MTQNMPKNIAFLLFSGLILAACANAGYEPVVDNTNIDPEYYQQDLADCRAIAEQVSPLKEASGDSFWGAGLGALTGAAIGAISGSPITGAASGAVAGGVGGTARGSSRAFDRRRKIIDNCLISRGYEILG